MKKIKALLAVAVMPLLFAFQATAQAQYPERPIRIITFAAPGGAVDNILRKMQAPLGQALGQQVVIDNKPGGGGMLALRTLAAAKPDGYTLGYVVSGMVTSALIQKQEELTLEKSFTPISLVADAPIFLYVNSKVPANSVDEFLRFAKAQPNPIPYSSTGVGLITHAMTELLSAKTQTPFLHVPYSAHAPSMQALMSGDVMFTLGSYSDLGIENVKAGRLKLLGVSSAKRSSILPNLPAIAETVPGFDATVWVGISAPQGTPPAIIRRLNKALLDVLREPDIHRNAIANGYEIVTSSPEEMQQKIVRERTLWEPFLAKMANPK